MVFSSQVKSDFWSPGYVVFLTLRFLAQLTGSLCTDTHCAYIVLRTILVLSFPGKQEHNLPALTTCVWMRVRDNVKKADSERAEC